MMTDHSYAHLGLTGWPFNRAGPETGSIWVGRPDVQRRMKLLLRSAERVPASQLFLLWADLGAGKTQALRHLEWMAKDYPDLITILLTTPRGITSFFDVYRAGIDGAITVAALASAGRDLMDKTIKGQVGSDVERAIIAVGTYQEESARIAQAWLRGDRVQRQAAKDIGVTSQIRTAAEAIDAMGDLIRVLRRKDRAVLLLVDEVQELADLAQKKRDEAVGGLHKVFDKNPEGLTMMLSFTAASQGTMLSIIGGPLSDRANETITLPAITPAEGRELVNGLIEHWSAEPATCPAPFDEDAIDAVIDALHRDLPELSPRSVILAFDGILREAELDIDEGAITAINRHYALSRLSRRAGGAGDA
jgi:hypothetical protein